MIRITELTVKYPDGTEAIRAAGFCIAAGENAALIGANGAGKTTLFLALTGILDICGGTARVAGFALEKNNLNAIRRTVGMVFQNPDDQLFMPTVGEDVAFGPRNFGFTEEETEQRVAETLAMLNIPHLCDRSPLKLSGGEKRMAAIAAVLALAPRAVLYDEPTAFLDPRARRILLETLKKLPHTKLVATHDLRFAAELCDRVILLKEGSVFADGGIELLYDKKIMDDCGLEAIPK
jgi:cobalt/nickel transport system ATP-binding protein